MLQKHINSVLDNRRETGPDVIAEKTKSMFMYRHLTAWQNQNIKTANTFFKVKNIWERQ
jgi:hypothetical protein